MKAANVKGTRDFLAKEVRIRDYMQNKILQVYQNCGFSRISTPILEDIENLDKSEGGENLNLIFRILKRGERLNETIAAGKFNELSDLGLRYDLTLPLSRYYANNKEKLMLPMKCIQIDKVYRAERPQRGRDREFMQCDIDIIGSEAIEAEFELIQTTAKALLAVGISDFSIIINDRRLLKALLEAFGVDKTQVENVCISIDKISKIGVEGLEAELKIKGISQDVIKRISDIISKKVDLSELEEITGEKVMIDNIRKVIRFTEQISVGRYGIQFDVTLVRGQGYYTGIIFEVVSSRFNGSIGGGGRYDNLIGKFTGENVPAVGFSIGFERIYTLLLENDFQVPDIKERIAIIYNSEDFIQAYMEAERYRVEFDVALYEQPRKLGKFLERLNQDGVHGFLIYGKGEDIRPLNN